MQRRSFLAPKARPNTPRIPSKGEPDIPTPITPLATPSYAATPDYAAGLGSEYEPIPMVSLQRKHLTMLSIRSREAGLSWGGIPSKRVSTALHHIT